MFNCINHSCCKLTETRDLLIFIPFGVKLQHSAKGWLWANVSSLKSSEARCTEENSAIELLPANTHWGCFSGTADESICTKRIDWKQKMLIAMDPENDGKSEVPPSLCSVRNAVHSTHHLFNFLYLPNYHSTFGFHLSLLLQTSVNNSLYRQSLEWGCQIPINFRPLARWC